MRLASIHIYPMKAGRAVDLDEALVEPFGLAGDRRWLLVDEDGRFISQREEPSLVRVVVRPVADGIGVSADGHAGRRIATPAPGAPLLKVTVWSSALLAAAAGPEADAWFATYLGRLLTVRRNSSTIVVLAGPAPAEVLAAVGRSMNVALYRPEASADPDRDSLAAAAEALQRAGRASSPYALVPADPLAAVATRWREMWDVTRQPGPAAFEQEAAQALAAWRAGRFELPDYYLVLGRPRLTAARPLVAGPG